MNNEDLFPEKIMLVDGNSILNRAFYGLKGSQLLSTSEGLHTNAVFGFINILYKFLDEEKPGYLCVAFDLKAPTFRHIEYEGYKAGRKGMPDELASQVPVIKEVLDAMNIKRLEKEGFEADDIIGTISLNAEKMGMDVVVITGDRDSLQLATLKTRIKIPVTRSGKTDTEEYDCNAVVARYGVTPSEFIDVKSLMGDPSDNIPGVPGIGEKTALELVKKYKSIENLYENIDSIDKKSVRDKLAENRELAFMSRKLAAIDRNIKDLCSIDETKCKNFDTERLYELFKKLEFKSFIERFKLGRTVSVKPSCGQIRCIAGKKEINALKNRIYMTGEFSIYYFIDRDEKLRSRLAGVSITPEADGTVYMDVGGCISEEDFVNEFGEILESADIRKYGHDLKNLVVYLKNMGTGLSGTAFDTMIAAYLIDPSREAYTLSMLAEEHLKTDIESVEDMTGKGRHRMPYKNIPVERKSEVAGMHSEIVFKIRNELDRILRSNGQEKLYYEVELPLVEVLADMEYRGFRVDIDGLRSFSAELEERISILAKEIFIIAGEEFNINSTKQLGKILFDRLGLKPLKKTKTGFSTDVEVLEQLAARHEIVSKILDYRQLVKLKSTYAEGLLNVINPSTGRIHSSFNQTVTATGRISSTEPNLQNIPVKLEMGRKIRKVFVPRDESFLLADADYSQIELRVLAHITNDANLIAAFRNNEDIHTATASQVFGIPKDKVTPLMRSRAKAVNFGIVYGIGDYSLSKDIGTTRIEARRYIDGYLDRYPGVKKYMNDIVEQGVTDGYVTTIFNRRRYLPELKSDKFNTRSFGERMAMNTPIQGSAADIIKIAMIRVYRELMRKGMKSRIILQVHDELIVETCESEREEVFAILKENMENAVHLCVPLNVEVKFGRNWYDTK